MIGTIVLYTLTADDAVRIEAGRSLRQSTASAVDGKIAADVHLGNDAAEGDVAPMIVTRSNDEGLANGQVFLDGSDTLWVFGVGEGSGPGMYATEAKFVPETGDGGKVSTEPSPSSSSSSTV